MYNQNLKIERVERQLMFTEEILLDSSVLYFYSATNKDNTLVTVLLKIGIKRNIYN